VAGPVRRGLEVGQDPAALEVGRDLAVLRAVTGVRLVPGLIRRLNSHRVAKEAINLRNQAAHREALPQPGDNSPVLRRGGEPARILAMQAALNHLRTPTPSSRAIRLAQNVKEPAGYSPRQLRRRSGDLFGLRVLTESLSTATGSYRWNAPPRPPYCRRLANASR
jgi:hypothetical protein